MISFDTRYKIQDIIGYKRHDTWYMVLDTYIIVDTSDGNAGMLQVGIIHLA